MDNKKPNGINKELKFDDAVIAKIVGITCNEVEGVYSLEGGMMANLTDMFSKDEDPTKGVNVDLSDNQDVSVTLDATVRYGEECAGNLQQSHHGNCQKRSPDDRSECDRSENDRQEHADKRRNCPQ